MDFCWNLILVPGLDQIGYLELPFYLKSETKIKRRRLRMFVIEFVELIKVTLYFMSD